VTPSPSPSPIINCSSIEECDECNSYEECLFLNCHSVDDYNCVDINTFNVSECDVVKCEDDGLSTYAIVGITIASSVGTIALIAGVVGGGILLASILRRTHSTPPPPEAGINVEVDMEMHELENNPLFDTKNIITEVNIGE
jgi:hypothetical protein